MAVSSVEAVAPVRLSGDRERLTGARFAMLVESLSLRWSDAEALRLTVVGLGDELEALRRLAGVRPNLELCFVDERELIGHPGILALPGWYKQMFIKLLFARICAADAYLYLDADVICVRPLGRSHLVRDGVALSDWEPKHIHAGWWAASRRLLGRGESGRTAGLGVTPNVLIRAIAEAIPAAVAAATGEDPLEALLAATGRDGETCWAENCLYGEYGEMTGELDRLHAPMDGRRRFHSDADLWHARSLTSWRPEDGLARAPDVPFMVVQSTIGIDPEWLRRRLALGGDAAWRDSPGAGAV